MFKNYLLNDIINFLGKEIISVYGDAKNIEVRYLKDPQNVDEFTLDWINNYHNDKQQIAETSKAKAIIVGSGINYSSILKEQGKVIIVVDNPKLAIACIGNEFFVDKVIPSIHPSAVINSDTDISKNVFVGANCVIGKSKIGSGSYIYPNTVIYDNVNIKNNVVIHSGSIIGVDGLGCERYRDGALIKFPHLGGVIIENDVEIGSNCTIAKGSLLNTIIGSGCKINSGSIVAHNCILSENVWISPNSVIAGSTEIKKNVTIYSNVVIREHLKINENVIIGMGSVVTKDIPAGETWVGNPARKLK